MLGLLEKISAVFSGVVLLGIGALYVLTPPGDLTPREFLPKVQFSDAPRKPPPPPPGAAESGGASPSPARPTGPTDSEIRQNLQKQRVPMRGPLVKKYGEVPRDTFERLKQDAYVKEELKLARSVPLTTESGKTRLKLDSIAENSLLRTMGFEEGDVIELIDGKILSFDEQSISEYYSMYHSKIEELENGGSVSVTVSRGGRPVHLTFSLQ